MEAKPASRASAISTSKLAVVAAVLVAFSLCTALRPGLTRR